jgi:hypothetical protein
MHTLIPVGDSARSLFEVPQLSSWIAEVEPGRLTWKPPYFQRRQFSMREGKWKSALNDATLIEETSPTTWQVQDKNGDHYFYNEGELRRATIGGSEIGFESSHGLISRIFQVSNNHSLLSAGYDQSGRILTISTEGGNLRFIWLNQLLTKVVVDNAAPLRFSYRSDLLLSVEDRMGVFRCFWRENPYALKGYSALSSLVLISNDGNNDYMYDIRNSVLSLRVKNKDGYVSEMQFLSRSGRVRAVR